MSHKFILRQEIDLLLFAKNLEQKWGCVKNKFIKDTDNDQKGVKLLLEVR